MQVLHVEVKDAYARMDAQDKPAAHRYRFERSGASLWRYDETTGESCQVTSNQIDKWSGGRCPNGAPLFDMSKAPAHSGKAVKDSSGD